MCKLIFSFFIYLLILNKNKLFKINCYAKHSIFGSNKSRCLTGSASLLQNLSLFLRGELFVKKNYNNPN